MSHRCWKPSERRSSVLKELDISLTAMETLTWAMMLPCGDGMERKSRFKISWLSITRSTTTSRTPSTAQPQICRIWRWTLTLLPLCHFLSTGTLTHTHGTMCSLKTTVWPKQLYWTSNIQRNGQHLFKKQNKKNPKTLRQWILCYCLSFLSFLSSSSRNAPTAVFPESLRKQLKGNTHVVMSASTALKTTILIELVRLFYISDACHGHAQCLCFQLMEHLKCIQFSPDFELFKMLEQNIFSHTLRT